MADDMAQCKMVHTMWRECRTAENRAKDPEYAQIHLRMVGDPAINLIPGDDGEQYLPMDDMPAQMGKIKARLDKAGIQYSFDPNSMYGTVFVIPPEYADEAEKLRKTMRAEYNERKEGTGIHPSPFASQAPA